jgi:hypothetical protein
VKKEGKHIRPLIAFKKLNARIYNLICEAVNSEESSSIKGKENNWYWMYAFISYDEIFDSKNNPPSFFFKTNDKKNNKGTTIELGRLLLTAWTYDIESWALNVGSYVYKAYQKKISENEPFNDLEFKDAVKHIRENIVYYYSNESDLKLYILQKFFKTEVESLLPEKPKELKSINDAIGFLEKIHKARLKTNKNWYVENYYFLEDYVYYLQELLDEAQVKGYLSEAEFRQESEKENIIFHNKIKEMENKYKDQIKKLALNIPGI